MKFLIIIVMALSCICSVPEQAFAKKPKRHLASLTSKNLKKQKKKSLASNKKKKGSIKVSSLMTRPSAASSDGRILVKRKVRRVKRVWGRQPALHAQTPEERLAETSLKPMLQDEPHTPESEQLKSQMLPPVPTLSSNPIDPSPGVPYANSLD